MRPLSEEQETVISIMRKGDRAEIYTSVPAEIKRFQAYAAVNPEWKLKERITSEGETVGVRYSVPKSYITVRKINTSMSEEDRKAAGERLLAARKKIAEAKASAASNNADGGGGGGSAGGMQPEKRGDGLPTDYGKGGRSKPPRPKKLEFFDKSLER